MGGNDEGKNMSNEGQAPPPGGTPPQGGHYQQAPQPGSYSQPQAGQAAPSPQPGQYAPQQGQYQGQPGQYAPQPGQYAHQQGQSGQYAPQQPSTPRTNPFTGIPVSDFVRDGVAALLLLVSLALPVTVGRGLEGITDGFNYIVLIAALLSVVSLALPYLARASIFPPSWTVHTTRLVRLVANAPYVVVVLVYVVLDALTNDDLRGVGTSFALGLAGAVLAAQPRRCELGPEDQDRAVSGLWWKITAGIGGFIALTHLVSLIMFFTKVGDVSDAGAIYVIGTIIAWLFAAGFSLWAIYGTVVQKSPSWRLTLIGIGTILVCAFVFGAGEDSSLLKIESMHLPIDESYLEYSSYALSIFFVVPLSLFPLGAIFVPAAAAAASAPATQRALAGEQREHTWIRTAVRGLEYAALVAAAAVVGAVLWFFIEGDTPTGTVVTTIILGLIAIAAAVYARMQLSKNPANGRMVALIVAGALFVLGLVILILVPGDSYGPDLKNITVGHLLLAFGLPALVAIALTAPKEVRGYFAANRPAPRAVNSAAYQWSAPAAPGYQYPGQQGGQGGQQQAPQFQGGQAPQTGAWQTHAAPAPTGAVPEQAPAPTPDLTKAPAPQAPAASHGYTAQQAGDPATAPAVLAEIVQHAPELRPHVARNPSTYPALVEWLGQLGDPEVDEALRSRQG